MPELVAINGLTLCHKNSTGMVRSTLPDVCKAPSVPVPFTNVAFSKDLAKGTTTVKSHKGAMCGIKGSEFSVSIGDEPGVGGGVISGVNLHRATFLSWSPNVFLQGKAATRLTDRMLMNKGNTISAGGYFTGPITGASKATLDLLCLLACNCVVAGTERQRCVHEQVKLLPKTPGTGVYSEVTFDTAGQLRTNPNGSPQTRYGVAGSRLDIVTMAGGVPAEFVEMKFGNDSFSDAQRENYPVITRRYGKRLQEIWVDRDCKCDGQQTQPAPVTVPAPQQQTGPSMGTLAVGAAILGGIACALAEPCGAAALAAIGLGGTAAALAN